MALRGTLARALTRNAMLIAMGSNVSPVKGTGSQYPLGSRPPRGADGSAALANKPEVRRVFGLRSAVLRHGRACERCPASPSATSHLNILGPEPGVRSKSVHFVCLASPRRSPYRNIIACG